MDGAVTLTAGDAWLMSRARRVSALDLVVMRRLARIDSPAMDLALWISLRAFGAQPSFANVSVAFLVCAVATASPTPGGLGAVGAALTGAMIRFGGAGGTAVVAVVAFRLVTYWLPHLPGAVAFRMLRRQGSL